MVPLNNFISTALFLSGERAGKAETQVIMVHRKLPIGIQDFKTIISKGYIYVDKTKLIYKLISEGKPYFLSRPRRFGKSLLISTLESIFIGRRDLFKNLWIDSSDWNWEVFPVIRLDMSTVNNATPELFENNLIHALIGIGRRHNLILDESSSSNCLSDLIEKLKLSTNQEVVVLVDEYDKPILDNIDNLEIARENRKILQRFYAILKAKDEYLRLIFLTGITKFAKVSLFSGLNNLNDITMVDDYSTLLGYTKTELEELFMEQIQEVALVNHLTIDECHQQIKEWYNGYTFSKKGGLVYNPFSTLKLFNSKDFTTHWFETGTPSFLIEVIKNRRFNLSNLEQINVDIQSFSSFDIEELPTLSLLYQTGYVTIKSFLPHLNAYCLGFPNREVSQSFSTSLLMNFATSAAECSKLLVEISANLYRNPWDYHHFFAIMEQIFALIPYDLYVKQEKHFHALFYLIIKLAGFPIHVEIHTQQGRADAVLESKERIIIFEFKCNETAEAALTQIHEKKYHQFYRDRNLPIYLVGMNFNGVKRVIDGWQVAQIDSL